MCNKSGITVLPIPLQVVVASSLLSCFIKAYMNGYIGGFAGRTFDQIREIKPAAQVLPEIVDETVDISVRKLPGQVTVK